MSDLNSLITTMVGGGKPLKLGPMKKTILKAPGLRVFARERFYKDKGVCVRMRFEKTSPFGAVTQTLHNVTEIHRDYPTPLRESFGPRIAFESDFQSTGVTYLLSQIDHYTTHKETKVWEEF